MPKYEYHATCSQCGKKFYAHTRKELLEKLRKHIWRNHADWMRKRIKAGLRKRKQANATQRILIDSPGNSFWNPSWVGFAERGLIEKVTGMPYEEVKSKVLDFFVQLLLGGVRKPKS